MTSCLGRSCWESPKIAEASSGALIRTTARSVSGSVADAVSFELPTVRQCHPQLACGTGDMTVGQDQTIRREREAGPRPSAFRPAANPPRACSSCRPERVDLDDGCAHDVDGTAHGTGVPVEQLVVSFPFRWMFQVEFRHVPHPSISIGRRRAGEGSWKAGPQTARHEARSTHQALGTRYDPSTRH